VEWLVLRIPCGPLEPTVGVYTFGIGVEWDCMPDSKDLSGRFISHHIRFIDPPQTGNSLDGVKSSNSGMLSL
jgi:hypothetical protein